MLKKLVSILLVALTLMMTASVVNAEPFFADSAKQAVFLSPLEDWRPTWHLEEYVATLEQAGYRVDVLTNENVSISFLKTGLGSYDLIIFRTDSFAYEGMNFYCSGEPVTSTTRKTYTNEISADQIQIGACLGFSSLFIKGNYPAGSLREGLVFVIDGYSVDLSSAFLQAGTTTYAGYDDAYPLGWGRIDALSIKWLGYLAKGYSVKNATRELYGYLDTGHGRQATWPAVFYYGNGDYKI